MSRQVPTQRGKEGSETQAGAGRQKRRQNANGQYPLHPQAGRCTAETAGELQVDPAGNARGGSR